MTQNNKTESDEIKRKLELMIASIIAIGPRDFHLSITFASLKTLAEEMLLERYLDDIKNRMKPLSNHTLSKLHDELSILADAEAKTKPLKPKIHTPKH